MKNLFKQALLVSAITGLCLAQIPAQAAGGRNGQGGGQNQSNSSAPVVAEGSLNQVETDYLLQMREEEKVARDVYLFLYEKWQLMPFSNISGAEQNHMDQVKAVMDAYQLADIALAERGQFDSSALQALYDDLIAKGSVSADAALSVGALVEEVDIKDLQDAIASTTNAALISMYTDLLLASENHLRAFVRNLGQDSTTYTAQLLPAAEVDRILKGENAEAHTEEDTQSLAAAMAFDLGDNSKTTTNANFSANLSGGTNGFAQDDRASLMVKWTVDPQDQAQNADAIVIAMYQADSNAPLLAWAKTPNTWQAWNGDLNHIPAQNQMLLGQNMSIAALSNLSLSGLRGTVMVYTGYRLGSRLVTQAEPVQFTVR